MLHRHLFKNRAICASAAMIAMFVMSGAAHGGAILFVDDDAPPSGDTFMMILNGSVLGQCLADESQKLLPDDVEQGDWFGTAVSVKGEVAVIGAPKNAQMGAVYIYRWNGLAWDQEMKLSNPDGDLGDRFGYGAAISGDALIVGAPLDDDRGNDSGTAYIYRPGPDGWIEEQELVPSDATAGDLFGVAVWVDGDIAIVGALLDDDNGAGGGSAYVFRFDGKVWVEEQKLLPTSPPGNDQFGAFVSISGDVAIVGAYWDWANGYQSGAAYIYRYDPKSKVWSLDIKLQDPKGAPRDNFGWSTAISGNVAIVGARGDDDNGGDAGSAFIYRFDGEAWLQEAMLVASDGSGSDRFGYSVDVAGDMAICGAWNGDGNEPDSGSAYIYQFDGTDWVEQAKLQAHDGADNDQFGFWSSIDDTWAIVGAWFDDDHGSQSGSAYVFGGLSDCNDNGTLDICDIADGTSKDANGNGIPDECEPDLDIKPGSCPNSFNRNGNGVLPVALVGTDDFDVTEVDLASIVLVRTDGVGGSIAPHEGPPGPHSEFEDVATPFEGEEQCDCHELEGDGLLDLSLKFKSSDLVDALGLDDLKAGDFVSLTLTGSLLDGTPFEAADCIQIVPPGSMPGMMAMGSTAPGVFIDVTPLDETLDGGGFVDFKRTYMLGTIVTLTAPQTHPGWVFVGWDFDEGGLSSFTVTRQGGFGLQPDDRTIQIIVLDAEFSLEAIYRPILP